MNKKYVPLLNVLLVQWYQIRCAKNHILNRTTRSHFQPLSLETNPGHVFYRERDTYFN